MINRVHKFSDIVSLQHFLNGGILGGRVPGDGYWNLIGLTLTFDEPAGSVVFTVSGSSTHDPNRLTLEDIRTQVRAAAGLSGVNVTTLNGMIAFLEDTPTNGVALSANDEEAKKILGFDFKNAVVGTYYTPPGVTPGTAQWVYGYSCNENCHVIFTWE